MQDNKGLIELVRDCRIASRFVARLTTKEKNNALSAMADRLIKSSAEIIRENGRDLLEAEKKGLSPAMVDRLRLDEKRLVSMSDALNEIVSLPDPVGTVTDMRVRPSGIKVGRMSIPLGVVCMIYESRPNVTSDAAGLCLKSGNSVILRGGSEAYHSNVAIVRSLHQALDQVQIPAAAITFVPTTDRKAMNELLTFEQYIDLVIPRGGEGLIRFVAENSRIPVIKHYKGVCHQYVDNNADIDMAIRLLLDGKLSRPGVCNALETLLVHKEIAPQYLPRAAHLLRENDVEMRGCERTRQIVPDIGKATEEDYEAEYLSLIIAIKIVDDIDDALKHLERFSSDHTEVIVTNDYINAQKFLNQVNASVVMVNVSSRFSDGGQFGLGAEIGISTTKLHAYGPMGLEALTTKKFIVLGDGQTRDSITSFLSHSK